MAINLSDLPPQYQEQIMKKYQEQENTKRLDTVDGVQPQGKNKYHNVPTKRKSREQSIRFQSNKEARRYDELLLMLRAGEIRNLKLQPQFTLQESYVTPEGQRVRAIQYIADFSYELRVERGDKVPDDWKLVVEDVKSKATLTAQYKIKRKLMAERYGIIIQEI